MAVSYTDDNARFGRLCRLIIDHGTSVLSDVLQRQLVAAYSSNSLEDVLNLPSVQTALSRVNSFNNQQQRLLYPNSRGKNNLGAASKTVTISQLDITLLCIMLRNVCKLAPPYDKVWDKTKSHDYSLEANITRIRNFRNTLYGHKPTAGVSNVDFHVYWCDIVKVLLALCNKYCQQDYDVLRAAPIDVDQQLKYERLLELWYQETSASEKAVENTKAILISVTKVTENTKVIVENQQQYAETQLKDMLRIEKTQQSYAETQQKDMLRLEENQQHYAETQRKDMLRLEEQVLHNRQLVQEKVNELNAGRITECEIPHLARCTTEETPGYRGRHFAERIRPRNVSFQGRESRLAEIQEKLTSGLSAVTQRQAIYGLGGIGKTELATEYAHLNKERYELIRWLDADETSIVNSFREFAEDLGVQSQGRAITSISQQVFKEIRNVKSWLLVYDNALDFDNLKEFLPKFENLLEMQHILVTSRSPIWSQTIPLDTFSETEALMYIKQQCGYESVNDCIKLAEMLGYLPLALAQATNYVNQHGRTIPDYLEMFETNKTELLSLAPDMENSETTIMTTWLISEAKIREESPEAAKLLIWCAYLAPNSIPLILFEAEVLLGSKRCVDKAVDILWRYSMVANSIEKNSIQIHRLVQFVIRKLAEDIKQMRNQSTDELIDNKKELIKTRTGFRRILKDLFSFRKLSKRKSMSTVVKHVDTMAALTGTLNSKETMREMIEPLVKGLSETCPRYVDSVEEFQTAYMYFPHINILLQNIESYVTEMTDSVEVLMETTFSAMTYARENTDARYIGETLLKLQQHKYGHSDVKLCETYSLLSEISQNLADAEQLCGKALNIAVRHYDSDSEEVLDVEHSMGNIRYRLGDLAGAKAIYMKIFPVYEMIYGKDSINVSHLKHNLALVERDQQQALSLFEDALSGYEKEYGNHHVRVADLLHSMSRCLEGQNKRKQRREFLQRACEICEYNKLKPENEIMSLVIAKIKNMIEKDLSHATDLIKSGDFAAAIDTYANLVPLVDKVHTDYSARTDIRERLFTTMLMSGNPEAMGHIKELLSLNENQFGPNSVEVAQTLFSLSHLLINEDKILDATDALKRAYSICEYNKSEPEHSLIRIINHMLSLEVRNDNTVSIDLMKLVEETFATDHALVTVLKLHNANSIRASRKPQTALSLYEDVFSRCEILFDSNSVEVAEALSDMSHCLDDLSKTEEAINKLKRAYKICEDNKLGNNHPTTLYVTQSITEMIGRQFSDVVSTCRHYITCQKLMPFIDKVYDSKNSVKADVLWNIGAFVSLLGDEAQAIVHFKELSSTIESDVGPNSVILAQALFSMSCCLNVLRKKQDAADPLYRAYTICEYTRNKSEAALSMIQILTDMISPEVDNENTVIRDMMTIVEETFSTDHPFVAVLKLHKAKSIRATGDLKTALSLYDEVLSTCELNFGTCSVEVLDVLSDILSSLGDIGKNEETRNALKRAYDICGHLMLDHDHPTILKVTECTVEMLKRECSSAALINKSGDNAAAIEIWQNMVTFAEMIEGENGPLSDIIQHNIDIATRL